MYTNLQGPDDCNTDGDCDYDHGTPGTDENSGVCMNVNFDDAYSGWCFPFQGGAGGSGDPSDGWNCPEGFKVRKILQLSPHSHSHLYPSHTLVYTNLHTRIFRDPTSAPKTATVTGIMALAELIRTVASASMLMSTMP